MQQTKRAVLFANGVLEYTEWLSTYIRPDDTLVAVDGGYRHIAAAGFRPHLLIGDLDSLDEAEIEAVRVGGAEILRFPPEKDQTDLELALQTAVRRGFRTLRVVAAFGGRVDHMLANIFLLDHPDLAGCDVRIENGSEEAFLVRNCAKLEGQAGDTVSLLPLGMPVVGVTTHGLAYPLQSETLWPHHSRGVSNVMVSTRAQVTADGGLLLCIHTHQIPSPSSDG